jgi:hypothetical protein
MSRAEVSFEVIREVVADYTPIADMEEEFLEPGEMHSGDPAEPGWAFQLRARQYIGSLNDKARAREPWKVLIEGATDGTIANAAALVVAKVIEHIGENIPEEVEHQLEGSAPAFVEAFANTFDLTVGAPELIRE